MSPLSVDTDADGIDDYTERIASHLDPLDPDDASDDPDNDGFSNLSEYQNNWPMTGTTNGFTSPRYRMVWHPPGSNTVQFVAGYYASVLSCYALGDAGGQSAILRVPPSKQVGGTKVRRLYHTATPFIRLNGTPLSALSSPLLLDDADGPVEYRVTAVQSGQAASATFWVGDDQGNTNSNPLTCHVPRLSAVAFRNRSDSREVQVAYGATGTLFVAWQDGPRQPTRIEVEPTITPTSANGVADLLLHGRAALVRVSGGTNYTANLNWGDYRSARRVRRGLPLPVGEHLLSVGLDWNLDGELQDAEATVHCTVGVLKVDLDVDSENTVGAGAPPQIPEVDAVEDMSGADHPGKIVFMNDMDVDGDLIPDFVDGFGGVDDVHAGVIEDAAFVQLVLDSQLPDGLNPAQAEVEFIYPCPSDPGQISGMSLDSAKQLAASVLSRKGRDRTTLMCYTYAHEPSDRSLGDGCRATG